MADIIVAGNTSGAITISAPLVAGSGVLTLPTGTDTLIGKATTDTLTNKSIAATQLTGTIAAAALPAGSVLQVVQGSTSTSVSNSTTTYTDTGLTATITPKFSTSKILIIVTHNGMVKSVGNVGNGINIKLLRGATDLGIFITAALYTDSLLQLRGSASLSTYDSPATTSATTYKTQFANISNAASVLVNEGPGISTITLMEIAV